MDGHEIRGYEIHEGEVKPVGTGAHALVPKAWIGADVKVVRITEPDST